MTSADAIFALSLVFLVIGGSTVLYGVGLALIDKKPKVKPVKTKPEIKQVDWLNVAWLERGIYGVILSPQAQQAHDRDERRLDMLVQRPLSHEREWDEIDRILDE